MPRPPFSILFCAPLFVMGAMGLSIARAQFDNSPPAGNQLPSTQPSGKLEHVRVDVKRRQVRVECEALRVAAPLEFLCVASGTNEHESLLRSRAKASDIHLGLLMLGLKPGEPVKYSEASKTWYPPHGPPVNLSLEFVKDGKTVTGPAYRFMRDVKTKKAMPATTWIFAGSRVLEDGSYAADLTGYQVSIVNFDLSLMDIPQLASSANETLEWETDLDAMPPLATAVTLIIEPTGAADASDRTDLPSTNRATTTAANAALSDVTADTEKVDRLHRAWEQKVAPHAKALQEAAQTQYEVVTQLRREQQRLIDEADRIQRVIDELEKQYQQMTTPRPEPAGARP